MTRTPLGAAALTLGLLAGTSPAADPTNDFRGSGLSFPSAVPQLGQPLELVGLLDPATSTPTFPMIPAHEYTWSVYGPVVHTVNLSSPGISVTELTFGVLEIREDPSPDSQFLPDPPNALVPSTFHDGTIVLVGDLTDLRIDEVFGLITAHGNVRFEGGTELGSLGALRTWTLDAAVSPFGQIPAGYGSRWGLSLAPTAPVGMEAASWGGIKTLYR